MTAWLIHPPFADPTQPYVSLPALKGWVRQAGLDVSLLDLNVEAARWLLSTRHLHRLAERTEALWRSLDRQRSLSFAEQRRYRAAHAAIPLIHAAARATPGPLEVFETKSLFHDVAHYERARRHADSAFAALDALHFPFTYSFNHATHSVVPWSFDLLETHARTEGPLDDFYRLVFESGEPTGRGEDGLPRVDLSDATLVGISIAFPSQLPEAWRLARWARRLAPRAFIALGGPSVHQVAIHLEPQQQLRLLDVADGLGLFEGEETLVQLLRALPAWSATRDPRALFEVPNLLVLDPDMGLPRLGPRWMMNLREAPLPDLDGLDLDRYLAPSRTILVAPTRGCYWNQCSFCYYGLSETATAKYREIPPDRFASHLARLAHAHGVKDFYFSCDVLSPVHAHRLAEAILARGLKVRWSSDLKIEKWFDAERCATLARSGLRAAAFGIESGSDRILSLMRKGVDRDTMTRVNRDFHAAGVATEWMTFTDHPGETCAEALETVRWVAEEREHVDLFIVGEFGLERGSAIYQDPKAFGVDEVWFTEGDELRLYAQYRESGRGRTDEERARIALAVDEISRGWRLNPYPWAGANSTHHTLASFVEKGQAAFRRELDVPARIERELASEHRRVRERLKPRYSLAAIEAQEDAFFERYLRRALYTTLPDRHGRGHGLAPLSHPHFENASSRVPELEPTRR